MAYDRSNEKHLVLYTDGGSRGNPGCAGIGFSLCDLEGHECLYGGAYIGTETNNVAEYSALLWGLEHARCEEVTWLEVKADSELMVKQINGIYRVKNPALQQLHEKVTSLLKGFKTYTVEHVYREENKRADELANQAMDEQIQVGNAYIPFNEVCSQSHVASQDQLNTLFSSEVLCEEISSFSSQQKGYPGVFRLTVKSHFDAAHALIGYPGECRRLHGHTWDVECTIKGKQLDEVGILYDFKAIKRKLNTILDRFDHSFMNDVAPFDKINSTAENLSAYIFHELAGMLPAEIELEEVVVWESPIAKTSYRLS